MKALVVGATGRLGRRVSGELLRSGRLDGLTLLARQDDELSRLQGILGGDAAGVRFVSADARDPASVARAGSDSDIVVMCGPATSLEESCIEAAIHIGKPYVSSCDDETIYERSVEQGSEATRSGSTIVTGCGFSPGLTNILAALAAKEFDVVEGIEIAIALSSRDADGSRYLALLARDAVYVSDGRESRAPAGGTPKPIYFPEPAGWVETFRSGHPEVRSLSRTVPGLHAVSFRFGLAERSLMDAARALGAAGMLETDRRRRTSVVLQQALTPLLEKIPPRGSPWSAARVEVRGIAADRPHTVVVGVVDHFLNLAVLPLACAALELGSGAVTNPGVMSPEQAFDAPGILRSLAQRGVRVARLEPHPV